MKIYYLNRIYHTHVAYISRMNESLHGLDILVYTVLVVLHSDERVLFKFKKTNTTLAHYTIQAGSCLPARTEGSLWFKFEKLQSLKADITFNLARIAYKNLNSRT